MLRLIDGEDAERRGACRSEVPRRDWDSISAKSTFCGWNPWTDLPRALLRQVRRCISRTSTSLTPPAWTNLDAITASDLLGREGASAAAKRLHRRRWVGAPRRVARGHSEASWSAAVSHSRCFASIGGNSLLPDTFAAKLGERVRLGSPGQRDPIWRLWRNRAVFRVRQDPKTMDADYLVCAMSAVMLRQIPVTPAWPEAKRWAIENMPDDSATRPVLPIAGRKFWREEKRSA